MRSRFCTAFIFVLLVAGCGGNTTTQTVPFANPSAKPSATPSAAPTAAPTAGPSATPAAETLTYTGTMTQTIATTYGNPAPQPSGTPISNSTVTSAWTSSQIVGLAPSGGTYDAHVVDVESGASPSPAVVEQTVSDTIYTVPASGAGNVAVSSVSSTNGTPGGSFADTTVTQYPVPRIVNVLPESAGATWTNTDQQTATETAPGGDVTVRTVAQNGSYTQTTTQPPLATASPTPPPTLFTFSENADGSGTYSTVASSPAQTTYSFLFSAAPIQIAFSSSDRSIRSTTYSVVPWWPSNPVTLYSETDVATTGVAVPASCHVSSSFPASARLLTQNWQRVDTIYGTVENETIAEYDAPGIGALCRIVQDRLQYFYDYTAGSYSAAQAYSDAPLFYGGPAPWKTVTTIQTLSLSSFGGSPAASVARVARPDAVAVDRAVAHLRRAQTLDMTQALSQGASR